MANTRFRFAVSRDGAQHSNYPAGNSPITVPGSGSLSAQAAAISGSGSVSSGSHADGDTISVSITGIGTNAGIGHEAWWGGIDGPIEAAANGTSTASILPANWTKPGGATQTVSNSNSYSGSKSILNNWSSSNYQFGLKFDFGARIYSLYTNCVFYLPSGFPSNEQIKFTRVTGDTVTGDGMTDDAYPNCYIRQYGAANDLTINLPSGTTQIEPGSPWWVIGGYFRQEFYYTFGTAGSSDGTFAWKITRLSDNVVVEEGSQSGVKFWDVADASRAHRYWVVQCYMGDNLDPTSPRSINIDRDFYGIANTTDTSGVKWVVAGNASTYAACTEFSICKLGVTWTNTGASVNLNKGHHASLAGKYLYFMQGLSNPINSSGYAL